MMFNWYSVPSFAAMLFFVSLAAYVLRHSPRTPATLAAVGAQMTVAAYLFGQGMQANASTPTEWQAWARNLQWGAAVSPVLWYWLTVLLLGEQHSGEAQRYLRRTGYPLGVLLALTGLATCAAIYAGDSLYVWSHPLVIPAAQAAYYRFRLLPGPLYPAFGCFLLVATLGAGGNLWFGSRLALDDQRRRRFRWLLLSAALFLVGVALLAVTLWRSLDYPSLWLGHVALAVAMAVMASNVAAYGLLIKVEMILGDLLYFLSVLGGMVAAGAALFLVAGPGYSFHLLELFWYLVLLTVLSQALVNSGRRLLDRLFFQPDVQRLRTNLATVVGSAPLAPDLGALLATTQAEMAEVSEAHMLRLTEEALRRLNRPSALAQCGLLDRLPHSLTMARSNGGGVAPDSATPLERASLLRGLLSASIERLKPADRSAAAALQYQILREEYLLGLPNKQIVARHDLSESGFHRQRREAVAILASELWQQEQALARQAAHR